MAACRRLSGICGAASTGNTTSALPADFGLLLLGDVHAALVVAQDQQLAARVDLAADAGAIAGAVGGEAVLEAILARIAGGMGELLSQRVLAPFIGARHMRQAKLPDGRWRVHALVA